MKIFLYGVRSPLQSPDMTATQNTTKGTDKPRNAPSVRIYRATSDARGFFESVLGFEKMAGLWFRLPADVQRYYFGNVPFGKRAIKVSETGVVTIFKTQAYGKDWDTWDFRYDHSAKSWTHGGVEWKTLPCQA